MRLERVNYLKWQKEDSPVNDKLVWFWAIRVRYR